MSLLIPKSVLIKSVSDVNDNSWSVNHDKEVKDIELYFDEGDNRNTIAVVNLKNGESIFIPFHAISRWITFAEEKDVHPDRY